MKPGFTLLLSLLLIPPAFSEPLSSAEARGKQLYLTGTSASGKNISAVVGSDASAVLPASALPCTSCHGEDGRGRSEGAIVPGNITFQSLTLASGHNHDNGRKHAPFTADTIAKAITEGVDPDGNKLDAAMPRYSLSLNDLTDLIAYLQRLATDFDPGLTAASLRIGTLLPQRRGLQDMTNAIRGILSAYFDEINAQGGIYGRKIQFAVIEYDDDAENAQASLRRVQATDPVFAMVATVAGDAEQGVQQLTESQQLPQIGPFTLFPETDITHARSTFFLLPGIAEQARAMVDYSATVIGLKKANLAVIGPEGKISTMAIAAIDAQAQKHAFVPAVKFVYSPGHFETQSLFAQIEQQTPDAIFYLGGVAEWPILLQKTAHLKKHPYIFIPGSLAGPDLLKAFKGFKTNVLAVYPSPPNAQKNLQEFAGLITKYRLPKQHLHAQIIAYSAAKLLIEGLKRTGRELNRHKLIDTLEHLYRFDNQLTPPLTFNANRHLGVIGAYIVPLDASGNTLPERWMEPQ